MNQPISPSQHPMKTIIPNMIEAHLPMHFGLGMKSIPMIFRHKPVKTRRGQAMRELKQVARTLGFGANWFSAAAILAIQEAAVIVVAKKIKSTLNIKALKK